MPWGGREEAFRNPTIKNRLQKKEKKKNKKKQRKGQERIATCQGEQKWTLGS
jgi:hypothetical protein